MKRYLVNEMFHSLQGEGLRAGTPAIFIRFAKCNLDCNVAGQGFDCDTDFEKGEWHTLGGLLDAVREFGPSTTWIILTGGEPALQVDQPLVDMLHTLGYKLAIETNGTLPLPKGLDWVCVSPKPGTEVIVRSADEVKCVVTAGQEPDSHYISAPRLISPAFEPCDHDGDCEPPACPGYYLNSDTLTWCIDWVKEHPRWRLSVQQHKFWGIR